MRKAMIVGCFVISLIGILGLNLIDSAFAQYGTYPTPKVEKMTDASKNKPMEKNMADHKMPPIKQITAGILPQEIQCNDDLKLIFSPSNKNPACVRQSTKETLVERGWLTVDNLTMVQNSQAKEAKTIGISAKEVNEVYRWSDSDGINPTITLTAKTSNVLQITNPTDVKHEFVIESNGEEVAASGDIAPDGSGNLSFTPSTSGVFEYHCEYHPSTMKGTINVK